MRKHFKIYFLLLLIETIYFNSQAQINIVGPGCVVPGTTYQYTITGSWIPTSKMNVCVKGGVIADAANSNECTKSDAPIAKVLIHWGKSGKGSLLITSSVGNAILNITITKSLSAGSIDSATKVQMIGLDSLPATITCSIDTGGSCSPIYANQWQQSTDRVSWVDLVGFVGQSLSLSSRLTQSMFYRRRVIEKGSGSIAYSDVASVFVGVTAYVP